MERKCRPLRSPARALFPVFVVIAFLAGESVQAQTTKYVSPAGGDEAGCGVAAQPCKTIGHALDVAHAGDTLSLAAGIYFESGLVIEHDVVVVGQGSDNTVIDGDGVDGTRTYFLASIEAAMLEARRAADLVAGKTGTSEEAYAGLVRSAIDHAQQDWYGMFSSMTSGYVVRVDAGAAAVIDGVTIRDGGGFTTSSTNGGIVNAGTLMIRNSVLEHNVAFHSDLVDPDAAGRGGAVLNVGSLTVDSTTIRRNFAVGFALSGGSGGGIYNEGSLTVRNSTLEGNEAWDAQDFCKGGGIANVGEAVVYASRIVGNSSDCFEGGAGGGVYSSGSLRLDRTAVAKNSARSVWEYSAGQGGGIASYGELEVVNSTVSRNRSGAGGGVYLSGPTAIISSTVVANDAEDRPYAAGEGGGLYARDGALTLWSSVVAGNRAGTDGLASSADCQLDDARFASDFVLTGDGTGCTGSSITVDPAAALQTLFKDTEEDMAAFVPAADGPAVDAGDCRMPGREPLALDQLGNARPFDDESVDNVSDGCDIGAVESQSSSGDKASDPLASSAEEIAPFEPALGQNYPNPFRSSTRIEFTVSSTDLARVVIYDLMGREVDRLVDGTLPRGTHWIEWTAEDVASGVYLCRLTVGSFTDVKQLTLAR